MECYECGIVHASVHRVNVANFVLGIAPVIEIAIFCSTAIKYYL